MPSDRASQRIIIAGASSLLGTELKSVLEESRFAGWEISLVDEESAAGTLTEAGGEPTVIQPVEEGTFARTQLIFFTGSAAFAEANLEAARASGATVIDLSGAALKASDASVWFALVGGAADKGRKLFAIPSSPGLVAGRLLSALCQARPVRASMIFFRPVSEAGRAGIEELESQTSQLLSFQPIGQPLFDTQVAFTLLDRYGSASRESVQAVKDRVRQEIASLADGIPIQPAIQVLHAPVFYAYTFAASAELQARSAPEDLVKVLQNGGFSLEATPSSATGNLTASGDSAIHLAAPEADAAQPETWWFWGAADNIRLPAATAVKLAEHLVA
jgi:aspartate-semialdehyde dehydrogenase